MDIERLCLKCMSDNVINGICADCGFSNKTPQKDAFLPHYTKIANRFLIGHALRYNGDGITYMGFDLQKECPVFVREFFPNKIAARAVGGKRIIPMEKFVSQYKASLMEFSRLANSLHNVRQLESLFPMYEFIEENGTAYTVSYSEKVTTLRRYLLHNGNILSWNKIKSMFLPLIKDLCEMHKTGIFHYGISLDTIFVTDSGSLKISGFSIKPVRTVNSEYFNSEVFDGFAAVEQYGFDHTALSAHTDIYSLAAVILTCLVGAAPAEATKRLKNDQLIIPAKILETIPESAVQAIANALDIDYNTRTQSMTDFYSDICETEYRDNYDNNRYGDYDDYDDGYDDYDEPKRKSGDGFFARMSDTKITIFAAVAAFLCFAIVGGIIYFAVNHGKDLSEFDPNAAANEIKKNQQPETTAKQIYLESFIGITFNLDQLKAKYPDLVFKQLDDEYSTKYKAGVICSQEPAGNGYVESGSTVTVTVSKGESNDKIPTGLKGLTYSEAVKKLNEAGYKNVEKLDSYDGSVSTDIVVNVDPAEGSSYDTQEKVALHVNVLAPGSNQ